CFCLLTLRPLSATPFPYTTLFRSSARGEILEPAHALYRRALGVFAQYHVVGILERSQLDAVGQRTDPRPVDSTQRRRAAQPRSVDRKSTRLNSSHVKISYAVFCLK